MNDTPQCGTWVRGGRCIESRLEPHRHRNQQDAEIGRLRQALDFARGTLMDIGSSVIPLADRDSLARKARAALATLDDYWPEA